MKRLLISALLVAFSVLLSAQDRKLDAVIEYNHASFTMSSPTSGVYKVKMKVQVMNKDAADVAYLQIYSDGFRSLSSFSGTLTSGGKTIKKYKMSDLKSVSMAEGGITDGSVSYLQPVAPVPYTVEYTYEVTYKNGFISFPSFVPLSDPDVTMTASSYVLTLPAGTEIMYKSSMEPVKESAGKNDVYTWAIGSSEGYVYEHNMPSIFEKVPYIYAAPKSFTYARTTGSQTDWESAGMWLYNLQKDVTAVPVDIAAKVKELTARLDNDRAKIRVLYEYLRQNTRYVSIQLGIGGLRPFPVETVMKSGFGDCKALSVYMQALLAAAGIRSEYLIIDTDRRNFMKDFYSVGQMNHAMLCVPMQNDTLWVECTNPRLPLGYRHDNVAGHEVVLIGESGGKKVRVKDYPDSIVTSVESVVVDLKADGSAHCEGKRYLSLDEVEPYIGFAELPEKTKFNAIMGSNSLTPSDFKIVSIKDNFEDWVTMEPGEDFIPEMTLSYTFEAKNYAKVSGDRIFVDINPFAKNIRADRKQRVNDFVRSRKISLKDVVTVTLPEGYVVESIPSSSVISNQFGTMETDVQLTEEGTVKILNIVQTVTLHPGRFPKEDYDLYRTFAKDLSKAYSARVVLRRE